MKRHSFRKKSQTLIQFIKIFILLTQLSMLLNINVSVALTQFMTLKTIRYEIIGRLIKLLRVEMYSPVDLNLFI